MASFAMRGYYHGQDYAQHIGKRYNVDPNRFDSITQAMLTADGDPSDLDEARGFDDWEKWLEAHNKE
eukprot:830131-Rhodomonas_salina.1